MKQKWVSVFLLNFITLCCAAQTAGYKYYCLLDTIKTAGFYTINLSPDINAKIKTDHSDLRLVNKNGGWIPHIFGSSARKGDNEWKLFSLNFSIRKNTKASTVLIIKPGQDIISNIGLIIKNAAAKRYCTLSGSDNQKDWFVINDSIMLGPVADEKSTTNLIQIDFPPSSYKYLSVTIYNNNKDPFGIVNVVQRRPTSTNTPVDKIIQNPAPGIFQKDSGKNSYVQITQQEAYHFEYIHLKLTGPKFFYRQVSLYFPNTNGNSLVSPGKFIQSFTISNNSTLQFKVPLSNPRVFYLLINNEDNLPLTVTEVSTAFDYDYIIAYLEKGDGYKLIMNNPAAEKPAYDLTNFSKMIPDSTILLQAAKITKINEKITVVLPVKNFKWILWISIITALIMLLFFTQRMIKEVDKTTSR